MATYREFLDWQRWPGSVHVTCPVGADVDARTRSLRCSSTQSRERMKDSREESCPILGGDIRSDGASPRPRESQKSVPSRNGWVACPAMNAWREIDMAFLPGPPVFGAKVVVGSDNVIRAGPAVSGQVAAAVRCPTADLSAHSVPLLQRVWRISSAHAVPP